MKLVDKKEAKEAAKECAFHAIGNSEYFTEEKLFEYGVKFAEQKISPLMIGFAEWIGNMAFYFDKITNKWLELGNTNKFTTEQLLEQFLKTRQK